MEKDKVFIRAYCERAEGDPAELMGTPITFVASTEGIKRDGLDLSMDGGDLENYRANPVVLWAHDYWGNRPPIGRAQDLKVEGKNLKTDVIFDQADDFARSIERKYRDGFLNAVSIGFDPTEFEGNVVTSWDLLDISAVPVPGDPEALMERQGAGIRSIYAQALEKVHMDVSKIKNEPVDQVVERLTRNLFGLEEEVEDPAEGDDDVALAPVVEVRSESVLWSGVSVAMAGIFDPKSAIDDEKRKSVYILLERIYRRLGKTAPEFLDLEELRSLGPKEIRGLFLEEEAIGAFLTEWRSGDKVFGGPLLEVETLDDARNLAASLVLTVVGTLIEEFDAELIPVLQDPDPDPVRIQVILDALDLVKEEG